MQQFIDVEIEIPKRMKPNPAVSKAAGEGFYFKTDFKNIIKLK